MITKLVVTAAVLAASLAAQPRNRASWMQEARWGVMTHYLADWIARDTKTQMTVERWNDLVNGFDVETLATQLAAARAGYFIITLGQNSGYYLAPNSTYDNFVGISPSKLSKRDLVADLHGSLSKRGIRLMLYLPSGAPEGDKVAVSKLGWQKGPYRNREFQEKWERVIREWSERYENKIAGWWFDGCYWPNSMYRTEDAPNFKSFAAAARAGHPDRAVGFNPGVIPRILSMTPYEDYTAGEIDKPELISIRRALDGTIDGVQIHVLSYLGSTWGRGEPRFTAGQAIKYTQQVTNERGAMTWDTPVQTNGTFSQPFVEQLVANGKAVGKQ
jgi:hypothetical protein